MLTLVVFRLRNRPSRILLGEIHPFPLVKSFEIHPSLALGRAFAVVCPLSGHAPLHFSHGGRGGAAWRCIAQDGRLCVHALRAPSFDPGLYLLGFASRWRTGEWTFMGPNCWSSAQLGATHLDVAMDDDDLEYTLLNKREVLVYQIPPASSSTGHKADDWKKCIWRGRLRIAGKGKDLSIKLLEGGGNLFAQCAIPGGDYNSYVERVIDSSRYFVLKISNGDRVSNFGSGTLIFCETDLGLQERLESLVSPCCFDCSWCVASGADWAKRAKEDQLEQDFFDPEANLALLKLYLLHPAKTEVSAIEGVLLKALMAYPATHFSLCMFQIPEKYHTDLKTVIKLSQQLEMAKFKSFWKESETAEALKRAKGWQEKVRDFIAGVISNMYRSIRSEQVTELLNLPAEELDARVKKMGWSRSKEDHRRVNREPNLIIVNTATFESARIEPKGPNHMTLDKYKSLFFAASSAA
eukprot:s274_g36.t1